MANKVIVGRAEHETGMVFGLGPKLIRKLCSSILDYFIQLTCVIFPVWS